MATYRMVHPDHGYSHAYDNAEVKRMKEAGWAIQTDKEFAAVLAAKGKDAEVEAEEVAEAAPVAKKKPGPKPKAAA